MSWTSGPLVAVGTASTGSGPASSTIGVSASSIVSAASSIILPASFGRDRCYFSRRRTGQGGRHADGGRVGRPDAVSSIEDGDVGGSIELHIRNLVSDDGGEGSSPDA